MLGFKLHTCTGCRLVVRNFGWKKGWWRVWSGRPCEDGSMVFVALPWSRWLSKWRFRRTVRRMNCG